LLKPLIEAGFVREEENINLERKEEFDEEKNLFRK
jgi:hypothetical protein